MARSCNDNTDMAEVLAVITNVRERDINQNVLSEFENLLKKDQQTLIPELRAQFFSSEKKTLIHDLILLSDSNKYSVTRDV